MWFILGGDPREQEWESKKEGSLAQGALSIWLPLWALGTPG